MLLLLRLIRKIAGWVDFILLCALVYLLVWLPWPGGHRVAVLFPSWCRAFARGRDVDIRVRQKHRKHLPQRYILIANHPSAFEDIAIPAAFDVVSLAKTQMQDGRGLG